MTRREEIEEILLKEERSAHQLANMFQTELKEILEDLTHIGLSVKPKKIVVTQARCKKCGFLFKERSRIKKPSKCPRCRGEWVQAPLFGIE